MKRERERDLPGSILFLFNSFFYPRMGKLITMIILISSVRMNELNVDITYIQICLSNFKEIKQKTKNEKITISI